MYDLFEKTSALQLRFPLHCTDEKLEVAIMKTLPIEYRACAANAKRVHSITSNEPYTFARFEDAITTFHRQVRGFDGSESKNDNIEAVLTLFCRENTFFSDFTQKNEHDHLYSLPLNTTSNHSSKITILTIPK